MLITPQSKHEKMPTEAFEAIQNLWIELGPLNYKKLRTIHKLNLGKVAGVQENPTPRVHNADGSETKAADYHPIVANQESSQCNH